MMRTWEVELYEILTFVPTLDYQAVYAEEENGVCTLFTIPLDGLAVCKVTERHYEMRDGEQCGRVVRELRQDNEIAGVYIEEGFWHIANGDTNFAGVCRVGDDIRKHTGCLEYEMLRKLSPEFRDPTEEL